jgi:hypothetical protein
LTCIWMALIPLSPRRACVCNGRGEDTTRPIAPGRGPFAVLDRPCVSVWTGVLHASLSPSVRPDAFGRGTAEQQQMETKRCRPRPGAAFMELPECADLTHPCFASLNLHVGCWVGVQRELLCYYDSSTRLNLSICG